MPHKFFKKALYFCSSFAILMLLKLKKINSYGGKFMPVIFKCVCSKFLMIPNKYIGKKAQCTSCHAIVSVPIPAQEKKSK